MEKIISTRQFAAIKRTAQNVNPMVVRRNSLVKKVNEMLEEINTLNAQIDGFESGIKAMCCGLGSEDLLHKVITPTDKVDKAGKPVTKTSYEPNDCLKYDEEHNYYVLTIAEPEEADVPMDEEFDDLEELKSLKDVIAGETKSIESENSTEE